MTPELPNSSARSGEAGLDELIFDMCREFERQFAAHPETRIESFWAGYFETNPVSGSPANDRDIKIQILAELIFVEMELRCMAKQNLTAAEYHRRFPGFRQEIEASIKRLNDKFGMVIEATEQKTGRDVDHDADNDLDFTLVSGRRSTFEPPEPWGPYREIRRIGSGGYGVVCRAIDSRNGQVVALKFPRSDKSHSDELALLLDEANKAMLLDEANKAMLLDHVGIARTLAVENHQGRMAIVQQYIDGTDLKATLQQERSQEEIASLVAQVARALSHAHTKGIYHRDLKPANILLDGQSQPFVADFGLALDEREQLHSPRQRCGTPHYMPPEQVAGLTRLLDGRSDLWSLGVILYELLTRRLPFRGLKNEDVFYQIENKDPQPPCQVDPRISRELQRICLRCLERQQKDRYPTADELADDLEHWLKRAEPETEPQRPASPMVPKGLRSYTAEDAAFFLDLLPGPRDRNGLPGSIRFWKSRIVEPVAAENRVPVGIIYGPSGSGKSSFIKAGLSPQLGANVLTVYVEATREDTEVRLLKSLRQRLVDLPEEISLPDLFRGLSYGNWLPKRNQKVLIVIDQFEQRLSRGDDFEGAQLVRALRFCDGEHLQCLLLTRDDFMMALSRFANALEMDIREGENTQAIDLFDRKHARKVLEKLGRAYHQLPPDSSALSKEQSQFLSEAVRQLAEDNHVICVRLALFAEMFRHRDWNSNELKQVGGVAGTGEKFLEATFGPTSRDKRLRQMREPAQRVLEKLLPPSGNDIRGAMKSEAELIAAAQLEPSPDPFQDLVEALDGNLKLITRTDPDVSGIATPAADRSSWFQLTHDYLVPSIRSWLDTSQKRTRAGRAKLRLRELAAQVIPGQPPRALPTHFEWVAWQFLIPRESRSENESTVMMAAGRRLLNQAGVTAAVILAIASVAGFLISQTASRRHVENLVTRLMNEEIVNVPEVVTELAREQARAAPLLRDILDNPSSDESKRLRAKMGILPAEGNRASEIVAAATSPDCSPAQLEALVQVLSRFSQNSALKFATIFDDASADPRSRFRAACAEMLSNGNQRKWSEHAEYLALQLWNEPVQFLDAWIDVLRPASDQLTPAFIDLLSTPDDIEKQTFLESNKAFALAESIFSFSSPERSCQILAAMIPAANDVRMNAICAAVEKHGEERAMIAAMEKLSLDEQDSMAMANRAVALARLGNPRPLIELYSGKFESLPTFLAINYSNPPRLTTYSLRQIYENEGVATAGNVNLRRSVLQALALHSNTLLDSETKTWLGQAATQHVLNDLDACCFSTAELILRRLETGDLDQLRIERRNTRQNGEDQPYGNVLILLLGNRAASFSVIDIPRPEGGTYQLAVSTTEATNGELFQFTRHKSLESRAPEQPFDFYNINVEVIYRYCNALSEESSPFYPQQQGTNQSSIELDFSRKGFRLPTVQEWSTFGDSNRVMEGLLADWPRIATRYAWVFENSQNQLRSPSRLLPNAAGLFDVFGNVEEKCHSQGAMTSLATKGQNIRTGCSALDVEREFVAQAYYDTKALIGFRVVTVIQRDGN